MQTHTPTVEQWKGGGEGWTEKAVILQASFRALIISSSKYF